MNTLNKILMWLKESRKAKNFIFFILSLGLALLLTRLVRDSGFTDSQDYVLFLLFFSIGLWLTEAIPPFTVALFIMAYLVFTLGNPRLNEQPENISKYVNTFSNSIIWLMLGGFFLAEAMTKTGIDIYFFRFSLRLSGNKPRNILLGLMLTTMVASMILSNTATTSMVLASVMPLLSRQQGKTLPKAILAGVPMAASLGGMGTIIGSPPNAIAIGALENHGIPLSFLRWMLFGIPLAVVLTFAGWWLLGWKFVKESTPIQIELPEAGNRDNKSKKMDRAIVLVVLILTVLLWLTSSLLRLTVASISVLPIVSLTMTGILTASDIRKLPWDTLLLVAGGLSLGLSLQETHLLEHFTHHILGTGWNTTVLLLVFAYLTMIFSNIMSNTATSTILIPLGIYMVPDDALRIAVTVGLAASTALLLPVSTPPNAIAYSTGMIKQKDFLFGGVLVGLLGPILIVALVSVLLG